MLTTRQIKRLKDVVTGLAVLFGVIGFIIAAAKGSIPGMSVSAIAATVGAYLANCD